jgi:4-hydroxythreonine-4-phosphate dehydrogenase
MKTTLAISMGDPAGISPEIIIAALEETCAVARPVIFGHLPTFRQLLTKAWLDRFVMLDDPQPAPDGAVGFVSIEGGGDTSIDSPDDRSAVAQFESLERATDAVVQGALDALVTAPVAKNAIATLVSGFSGHTEYLARRSGMEKDEVTMIFASDALSVGMVTTHIPLRSVPDAVTWKRLERTYTHVLQTCEWIQPGRGVRIGVAALNPHAGEDGLFGTEEQELLTPFCQTKQGQKGVVVEGPLPADMIYRNALHGKYDGVVASYHDQALIPLKLGGIGQMVNLTMGLPFIRTSPDHGVAYDIARTGRADASGFLLAVKLAARMARAAAR